MVGDYYWFFDTKEGGFVDFVSWLLDGYEDFFEFPSTLWHECLNIDVNHFELIDAQGNVHKVKMVKEYGEPFCSFSCKEWVKFISRFSPMKPKFIHLDQVDMKTLLLNFYTKDGAKIHYVLLKTI